MENLETQQIANIFDASLQYIFQLPLYIHVSLGDIQNIHHQYFTHSCYGLIDPKSTSPHYLYRNASQVTPCQASLIPTPQVIKGYTISITIHYCHNYYIVQNTLRDLTVSYIFICMCLIIFMCFINECNNSDISYK